MDLNTIFVWAQDCLKQHYPSLYSHCWFTPNTTSDWGKVTIHLYSQDYGKDAVKTAELEWSEDLITLITPDFHWIATPEEINI
jgi:hypothetical protein